MYLCRGRDFSDRQLVALLEGVGTNRQQRRGADHSHLPRPSLGQYLFLPRQEVLLQETVANPLPDYRRHRRATRINLVCNASTSGGSRTECHRTRLTQTRGSDPCDSLSHLRQKSASADCSHRTGQVDLLQEVLDPCVDPAAETQAQAGRSDPHRLAATCGHRRSRE